MKYLHAVMKQKKKEIQNVLQKMKLKNGCQPNLSNSKLLIVKLILLLWKNGQLDKPKNGCQLFL